MARPPLSVRSNADEQAGINALHEGVPGWMRQSAADWLRPLVFDMSTYKARTADVLAAERYLKVELDRPSQNSLIREEQAAENLIGLLAEPDTGLDLLDYFLGVVGSPEHSLALALRVILEESGSAWTVGSDGEGRACLEKRLDATVAAAARATMEGGSRESDYLRIAWNSAFGRNPNPSEAYRNAVRAVEAIARPVISPDDSLATIGKMAAALKAKPEKWTTTLGDVGLVESMLRALSAGQHDRHGTDDETTPLTVSQAEAEAAVHLAVTLVQWFRSGVIRRADPDG
ncbi:hypothetical protein [Desertimonas flava]|uniref:hypothetical protein n=1 Tax=Desertimonas flava TaxID=2064846 RepID=UPI001782D83B|nr:hypothetical protein [Desertimonas flava]